MRHDEDQIVAEDGIKGLRQYIQLLESLLASARVAERLFHIERAGAEVDPEGPEALPLARTLGFGPAVGPPQGVSEYGEAYAKLEAALIAEMPRGNNRVVRALRVIAAANEGQIDFGLTCQLLMDLGVCRGTPANVGSYISKRLRLSDEFERIGEPGTGLYRWLSYQEEGLEDAPGTVGHDLGSSSSPGTVGGS